MESLKRISNELQIWLLLEQFSGIGPRLALKIIKSTPSLSDFFNNLDYFQKKLQLPYQTYLELKNGVSKKQLAYCQEVQDWLDSSALNHVLTYKSPYYPELLRQIHNPPSLLYVHGSIDTLSLPQIAIVGTRNATNNGLKESFLFAKDLAMKHYTITSGLAIGIDTQAHLGAINVKGKTIAVLGTGLNQIYPKTNQSLVNKICDYSGTIISEFPLDSRPDRFNFPKRNRIISGLSLGTLVIECSIKSGSLITAKYALEQNREIFSVPGTISNSNKKGCHQLIKEGAKLVTNVEDILTEIDPLYQLSESSSSYDQNKLASDHLLSEIQKKVLSHINYQNTSINIIIEGSKLTQGELHEHLFALELMQKIEVVPGGYRKL